MTESEDDGNQTYNVVQRKTNNGTEASQSPVKNNSAGLSGVSPSVGAELAGEAGSKGSVKVRRSRIPDKPNISFSLWSIMKNCIGKNLES